jgi:hypothetical protein
MGIFVMKSIDADEASSCSLMESTTGRKHTMQDIFTLPFDSLPKPDELVQAAMRWHFHPETGSPFWLRQKEQFRFDPLKDVHTVEDLRLFPDVSALWKNIAIEDLIPAGCRSSKSTGFCVFESGSTTGSPTRIIEMTSRKRGVEWVDAVLTQHAIPKQGHWLHIGPTGPHIVGRSIGVLAQLRQSLCYYIDFDPRWVKVCMRQGKRDIVNLYVEHILDQAVAILQTQPVSMIFATPPILEAICARPTVLDLFRRRARVIIWAGTSMSEETLYLLEHEFFPEAQIIGWYGNTLMGIACQRPRHPEDTELCVFQPFYPYCMVDVVKPDQPTERVNYGEMGQVRVTLLTRELFFPNALERDSATRQKPIPPFPWDGLARVGVFSRTPENVIEGVY